MKSMELRRVVSTLDRHLFRMGTEAMLHHGIMQALATAGLTFQHEHAVGDDRFDFLVPPGIVIEVKTKGSASEALAQVARYAKRDDVTAIVLAATCAWARDVRVKEHFNGKEIRVVKLRGAAF